jgi:hypothetical protein
MLSFSWMRCPHQGAAHVENRIRSTNLLVLYHSTTLARPELIRSHWLACGYENEGWLWMKIAQCSGETGEGRLGLLYGVGEFERSLLTGLGRRREFLTPHDQRSWRDPQIRKRIRDMAGVPPHCAYLRFEVQGLRSPRAILPTPSHSGDPRSHLSISAA